VREGVDEGERGQVREKGDEDYCDGDKGEECRWVGMGVV
jgi:hypothetical protein